MIISGTFVFLECID